MAVGNSPLPEGVLLCGTSRSGPMTSVAVEAAARDANFSISVCSCLTPSISCAESRTLNLVALPGRTVTTSQAWPSCLQYSMLRLLPRIEVTVCSHNLGVCRTVFCGVQQVVIVDSCYSNIISKLEIGPLYPWRIILHVMPLET